jgi:hypothetical protein
VITERFREPAEYVYIFESTENTSIQQGIEKKRQVESFGRKSEALVDMVSLTIVASEMFG